MVWESRAVAAADHETDGQPPTKKFQGHMLRAYLPDDDDDNNDTSMASAVETLHAGGDRHIRRQDYAPGRPADRLLEICQKMNVCGRRWHARRASISHSLGGAGDSDH